MAYKMTHSETDQKIEVDASSVEMYQSQGWETAPTAKPPTEKSDDK